MQPAERVTPFSPEKLVSSPFVYQTFALESLTLSPTGLKLRLGPCCARIDVAAEVCAAALQPHTFCATRRFGALRLVRRPPDLPDLLLRPCHRDRRAAESAQQREARLAIRDRAHHGVLRGLLPSGREFWITGKGY